MQLNQEKGERAGPHQYQRHTSRQRRRVTQNEIYQDAIKILDKLLTQNIEERQRSASRTVRQKEAKTKILEKFSHGGHVGGYAAGDHAFSQRAQTVPESVYKPDRRRSEDRQMIILNHPGDKIQTESVEDVVSSADTEASEHEDDSPRKKKSFFKRAKERLRYTFRRDQRQKEDDYEPQEKSDTKSKRQKPRSKAQKEDKKKQSNRNSPKKTSSGQSVESGVVKNGLNSSLPSTTESNTSGQPRRKSFLKSVRHSFSRSKKDGLPASKSEEPVSHKAGNLPGRSASVIDNPQPPSRPQGPPSAPPEVLASVVPRRPPSQSANRTSDARLSQFRLSRFGPVPFMDEGEDMTDSGGKSNSISPDRPSSPQDANTLPPPPPPPPAAGRPGSPRLAAIVDAYITADQVVQGADGSVIRGHMSVHRQISLEVDGDELPFAEKTDKEKEALYQSIADKLREMADSLPISASEGEGHRQGAAFDPNAGQSELTELEKELMMVMRTGGDRLSTAMDDPTDTMTSQVKEQVYSQFSRTLRHAIGDEVGWNELAMFFHITKGAFSAADTTSKVLSRGKEMVMRYFADRFAGWIVQQGGWESMLSESDSELD